MKYLFEKVEVSEGAALLHRRLSAHVSPADAKYNAFWELYARHPMTTKELKNWCTCTREYGAFRCADCPFAWLKNDDAEDGPNDCPRGWPAKDFGYVVELAKAIVQSKSLGVPSRGQAESRVHSPGQLVGTPYVAALLADEYYRRSMAQLGASIRPATLPSPRVVLRRKLLGL